jgi:hypothetical protein
MLMMWFADVRSAYYTTVFDTANNLIDFGKAA